MLRGPDVLQTGAYLNYPENAYLNSPISLPQFPNYRTSIPQLPQLLNPGIAVIEISVIAVIAVRPNFPRDFHGISTGFNWWRAIAVSLPQLKSQKTRGFFIAVIAAQPFLPQLSPRDFHRISTGFPRNLNYRKYDRN